MTNTLGIATTPVETPPERQVTSRGKLTIGLHVFTVETSAVTGKRVHSLSICADAPFSTPIFVNAAGDTDEEAEAKLFANLRRFHEAAGLLLARREAMGA